MIATEGLIRDDQYSTHGLHLSSVRGRCLHAAEAGAAAGMLTTSAPRSPTGAAQHSTDEPLAGLSAFVIYG
jgi:hypothetical protein